MDLEKDTVKNRFVELMLQYFKAQGLERLGPPEIDTGLNTVNRLIADSIGFALETVLTETKIAMNNHFHVPAGYALHSSGELVSVAPIPPEKPSAFKLTDARDLWYSRSSVACVAYCEGGPLNGHQLTAPGPVYFFVTDQTSHNVRHVYLFCPPADEYHVQRWVHAHEEQV